MRQLFFDDHMITLYLPVVVGKEVKEPWAPVLSYEPTITKAEQCKKCGFIDCGLDENESIEPIRDVFYQSIIAKEFTRKANDKFPKL